MTSTPRRITLAEAEREYGIVAVTWREWCLKGWIPGAIKVGHAWMIPVAQAKRLSEIRKASQEYDPAAARALRLQAGVTQVEAANELGITDWNLSLWENGRYRPRGEVALRYRDLLKQWADRVVVHSDTEKTEAAG